MTKKLRNLFLVLIAMVLFTTNVDAAYYNNSSTTVNYTNVYIKKFPKYTYYIDLDSNIPFEYTGEFKVNSNFKSGGLINKYEFEVAGATNSYLFNGSKYFTMTEDGSNIYNIDTNGIKTIAKTSKSGDRVTEYIKEDVVVTGTGTYVDPWMFTDKYELNVSTNEPSHSTISPETQYVTTGKSGIVNFTVDSEYEYVSNTCGGTVTGNTMTVNNMTTDKTCEIRFKHKKYIITYDSNGGSECSQFEVTPGSAYGTLCASTRTGYTLEGWYTALTGGTKVSSTTVPTANTRLYARWTAKTYTLNYNLNGGSGCTTGTLTYGNTYGTLCTPTKTGYTFDGWYTAATGGTKVTADKVVDTTTNITIYAHWTAKTYKITYNVNGGSGCTSTKTVTYDQTYGELCTPTKSGISFKGWYTALNGGTLVSPTDKVKITSDTTLYAQWELSCFAFDSSTGTITNYYDYYGNDSSNSACPRSVTIPSSIAGVTVKKIGDSAFREKNITSVSFPNTITTIGNYAFENNKLTKVVIQEGVTSGGRYSFSENQITSVSLPTSLKTIPNGMFNENKISSLTIQSTVTSIGSYSFYNNVITSLTVPASVGTIGSYAFGYNKISNLSLTEGITTINYGAFYDNEIPKVVMPSTLTYIGDYAFSSNNISSLTVNNTIEHIGTLSFFQNKIPSLTLPSTVTHIGGGAFNDNQLPDSRALFYARNSDGTIDYTKVVSYGGAKRSGLAVPSGVITIGEYAYYRNDITSLTLTSGITKIEYYGLAFNDLDTINIPNTVTTIEEWAAFANWAETITIPTSVTSIGPAAFNANHDSNNPIIYKRNSDGTEDKTTIIGYKNGGYTNSGLTVTVPSGVTTIDDFAFWNCFIQTINIPEGVTTIGDDVFGFDVLRTVTVPSTVTSIGYGAFDKRRDTATNGSELNSNPNLTKIINKTGKSFNWGCAVSISDPIYNCNDYQFVTGTVENELGNVTISAS